MQKCENTDNTLSQPQKQCPEVHNYDVPASTKVANDYDRIDFDYEQAADHPSQHNHTNGGTHLNSSESSQQQKYSVLVHSSSMDKLGKSPATCFVMVIAHDFLLPLLNKP